MNRNFRVGWWLVVLTIILMFAMPVIFTPWFSQPKTAVAEYTTSILAELTFLIPAAIGVLYIKTTQKGEKNVLAIKKCSPITAILSVPTILSAQYFITYMTLPVQALLIILFGIETATTQMTVPSSIWEFLTAFAALCIVAPVVEEVLCRGVLIKLFEQCGEAAALISSAIAFAMLHFEARSFIQIFFVGLLIGAFRIGTGSIVPCIIMHAANNLFSLLQLMLFNEENPIPVVACIVLAAMFVPLMYITFVKCGKYFDFEKRSIAKERVGFSLGACICIACFAIYNIGMLIEHIINL